MAQPRHKTRHVKKAGFLAAYRDLGSIRGAAERAGVDRSTVYRWLEHDEQFLAAFHLAEKDACEALEMEARRRAVEGVRRETPIFHEGKLIYTVVETRYSDGLLTFLLRGAAPDKYRERVDVTQTQVVKTVPQEAFDAV